MNLKLLREYIRKIIMESSRDEEGEAPDDLLVEPDVTPKDEEETQEVSAGGVAGATTPLGTDATYPASRKRRKNKKN